MSKEEFLKIQKSVLKVNIHCDGCKHKVKKILQKIDGVFTTEIDAEQGKVTVSGNVDPNVLISKLAKSGKHAELWSVPKPNNNHNNHNNHNHLADHFKNMQISNPKGGGGGGGGGGGNHHHPHNNNKGHNQHPNQNQKGAGGHEQAKAGGGGGHQQQGSNPQQQLQLQHQQRLQQQLQQMKGFPDLKLPQLKDLKHPTPNINPNAKAVKFDIHEEDDDFTDDELDDYDDEDDDLDDEFQDDEMDDFPPSKMKQQPPMMMNAPPKGANNGGKKGGGGGPVPVQVHGIPGNGGGKKGGAPGAGGGGGVGGNHQNQGGGNKNNAGGGGAAGGGGSNNNGVKKANPMGGVGVQSMQGGFQSMGGGSGGPHATSGPNAGLMGMPVPNIPAVQGLPAGPVNGGGYFQGAGPDSMPGNPFHHQQQQQQQQRAMMGNDRFQPMMYARPPPAVNYMYPPYPYPYPYPHPPPDPYTHFFSDENTSSCNVM